MTPRPGTLVPAAKCSGCGEPIFWAETINTRGTRKPFPCNVLPDPRGNVTVINGIATVLTRGQGAGATERGVHLYTSHFATCTHAHQFRTKQRRR